MCVCVERGGGVGGSWFLVTEGPCNMGSLSRGHTCLHGSSLR